jgi:conjugative transposon TraK protein
MIAEMQRHVYVLDNGKSLMLALSQEDMMQNRPAEARHHVKMFHELFFTLSPDNDAINYNIRRAFYLSDKSAFDYFNDLKEAGYYRRLIANNILQWVQVDSIACNMDTYPYQAKTFAQQVITRGSNVTRRSLVTVCGLQNALRSDNNPHGFLIINFKVVENNELFREKR